jgi:putative PIN family toxin of toxin-antitoxin system
MRSASYMNTGDAATRLRAVLDTNIYIAAFGQPTGPTAKLWTAALTGRCCLLISPPMIRELAKVLRAGLHWQEQRIQRRIRVVAQAAQVISPQTKLRVVRADPDDDRILECASDGRADLIVTNDRHLLELKVHQNIPIIAGPDFRRILALD